MNDARSEAPPVLSVRMALAGLLMAICVAAIGTYAVVDDITQLGTSLEKGALEIRFNNSVLFMPGAMLAPVGIFITCGARLVGVRLSVFVHRLLQYGYVAAVVLGVAGRVAGAWLVADVAERSGYAFCESRSTDTARWTESVWVRHDMLCDPEMDLSGLTLDDLRTFLREQAEAAEDPPVPASKTPSD